VRTKSERGAGLDHALADAADALEANASKRAGDAARAEGEDRLALQEQALLLRDALRALRYVLARRHPWASPRFGEAAHAPAESE
jgi:hypothetical protein